MTMNYTQVQPVEQELPRENNLRRIASHPRMMHYNRLIVLVAVVNLIYAVSLSNQGRFFTETGFNLGLLSNLFVVNISMAILIRQQYVINWLFKIATSVPTSWPLAIRHIAGKVYHFGGIHVGGSVVGTLWFAVYTYAVTAQLIAGGSDASVGLAVTTYLLIAILVGIIVLALPPLRQKHHDRFEHSHRFGGWAALILFWVQTLLANDLNRGAASFGAALVATPAFWLLVLVTFSIILPWLRLKKVPVEIVRPSNHVALVKFDHGVTPFAGSSTPVSRNPLMEWHSFANVPSPHEDGFRLTISRAGDWTGQLIDDVPSHVWVKGIPTAGVGNIDKLFKKVVWIATGSGIGPTLPHLLSQEVPAKLVWSTRNARQTYGDDLVEEILAVSPDALIWDTNERGRPDLVKLAYQAVRETGAEAVICISNKKLTWQVVHGMESRGIPAYGAIWDS